MKNLNNHAVYKKYLAHSFFSKFTEALFFVFGALLLYEKTQSIFAVLLFGLIVKITSLLFRTIGLDIYFRAIKKFGILNVLGLGAVLISVALAGIFYINAASNYFFYLFYGFAIIKSLGNTLFQNVSSAIKRQSVGLSKFPGKLTSGTIITNTLAQMLAVITALFLSFQESFLFSFIVGSLFQLFSIIPLYGIKLPKIKPISFTQCMKKISLPAFFANVNIEHELKVTALPLILIFIFTSIETSIWISSLVAIGTVVISYIAGNHKDKKKKWLTIVAFIVYMSVWIVYGFVSKEILFIVLGIVGGFAGTIIEVGREARLSREVSNSKTPLETTIGIEIPRQFGMLLSFILLIITYLLTNTIPQWILVLGALFIIPKALYAIGEIIKKNNL